MALVQVKTPAPVVGGPATQAEPNVTAAAAETSGTTPRLIVIATSFAGILAIWVLSIWLNRAAKPSALVIPAGIGLFAMFYAVTQGLERLLEPISAFFYSTKQQTGNRDAALAAAVNVQNAGSSDLAMKVTELAAVANAQTKKSWRKNPVADETRQVRKHVADVLTAVPKDWDGRDVAAALKHVAERLNPPSDRGATEAFGNAAATLAAERDPRAAVQKAAAKLVAVSQAELDQRRADKAVVYWAIGSALGLLLSGVLGLYLLHVVGLKGDGLDLQGGWTAAIRSGPSVRHMIDLLITGLAIGGGTKPLHDLIANLQEAKNGKKDPNEVSKP